MSGFFFRAGRLPGIVFRFQRRLRAAERLRRNIQILGAVSLRVVRRRELSKEQELQIKVKILRGYFRKQKRVGKPVTPKFQSLLAQAWKVPLYRLSGRKRLTR